MHHPMTPCRRNLSSSCSTLCHPDRSACRPHPYCSSSADLTPTAAHVRPDRTASLDRHHFCGMDSESHADATHHPSTPCRRHQPSSCSAPCHPDRSACRPHPYCSHRPPISHRPPLSDQPPHMLVLIVPTAHLTPTAALRPTAAHACPDRTASFPPSRPPVS